MCVWIFSRPPLSAKLKAQLCLRGIEHITSQGGLVRIDTPKDGNTFFKVKPKSKEAELELTEEGKKDDEP